MVLRVLLILHSSHSVAQRLLLQVFFYCVDQLLVPYVSNAWVNFIEPQLLIHHEPFHYYYPLPCD